MLQDLIITNFALIDHLELSLEPGLNVLTGETGAGKSIIVDAIGLLLGERAEEGSIRAVAEGAKVDGLFSLSPEASDALESVLATAGVAIDDGEVVVVREINHHGRNICRVNGSIVPLRVLSGIAELLVDIHGQSQHLSLLNVREHLQILDRYAGLENLRASVADGTREIARSRGKLATLRNDTEKMTRLGDLLQYQYQEIIGVKLQPGEDEALKVDQHLAANAERLQFRLDGAYQALYDSNESGVSAIDQLGVVAHNLVNLVELDPSFAKLKDVAESLVIQAQELAHSLQSCRDEVERNPQQLQEIEERLEVIQQMKRKYGATIDDVLAYATDAAAQLDGITNSDQQAEALETEIALLLTLSLIHI